jgi:hypothetical protein
MNARDDYYEPDDEDWAYELYKERALESYRTEYAYIDRELRDYRKHTDRQLRELSKEKKSFERDCKLELEFNLAANRYSWEPSIVESRSNKASRPLTPKDKRRQKKKHRKAQRFFREFMRARGRNPAQASVVRKTGALLPVVAAM